MGFAGYHAYQKSQDSTSATSTQTPSTNSQSNQKADETATWKSYSRYGVAFKYPADWSIKADDSSQSTAATLTGPDFSVSDESPKGERITVDQTQFAQTGLTAENFKTKHLDLSPNEHSDYKVLTVNDKKAVQFYSGDSRTTVFFLANDKTVTFVLDTFPDRAAASATYSKVIETITIN
ncbi:MAG TPA: hypothetical protein VJ836_02850 [Candidatus Saccharimonadales bacterium]|nr:hypothetical protein [Candidatus Saccharimonadales bacterium]